MKPANFAITPQNIKRLDGAGYEHFLSCESLQSFPKWETDTKISCEQTLQKGDGPKTSWTREVTNDGELILVTILSEMECDDHNHVLTGV